jgi:hypothetical protein
LAPPGTTGMFASCAFAESSKLGLHSWWFQKSSRKHCSAR